MTSVVLTEYIYIFVWRALACVCTVCSWDCWIGNYYKAVIIRVISAGKRTFGARRRSQDVVITVGVFFSVLHYSCVRVNACPYMGDSLRVRACEKCSTLPAVWHVVLTSALEGTPGRFYLFPILTVIDPPVNGYDVASTCCQVQRTLATHGTN